MTTFAAALAAALPDIIGPAGVKFVRRDGRFDRESLTVRVLAALPDEWLDAIGWAEQLLDQGYVDVHVVDFSETGYGLQHPIACRPDLIGCRFNQWLADGDEPDQPPGRYVMRWSDEPDSEPEYEAVAA